jgi:hypothetical protein
MDEFGSAGDVFGFVLGLLDPDERAIVAGVNQQWRDGVLSSPHPFTGQPGSETHLSEKSFMTTAVRMQMGVRQGATLVHIIAQPQPDLINLLEPQLIVASISQLILTT